jgi:hypothetical protein
MLVVTDPVFVLLGEGEASNPDYLSCISNNLQF